MLLVDEPTSALDHRGEQIVELLGRVTRERRLATVMVTHDLAQLTAAGPVCPRGMGAITDGQCGGGSQGGRRGVYSWAVPRTWGGCGGSSAPSGGR